MYVCVCASEWVSGWGCGWVWSDFCRVDRVQVGELFSELGLRVKWVLFRRGDGGKGGFCV